MGSGASCFGGPAGVIPYATGKACCYGDVSRSATPISLIGVVPGFLVHALVVKS